MESSSRVDLSVIVPVYNGAKILPRTLAAIEAWLQNPPCSVQVIFVNDGSLDATSSLLSEFASRHSSVEVVTYVENRGKGYAVKRGLAASRGAYVLFTDADLSYGLEIVEKMYAHLIAHPGIAFLYGSRHHELSTVRHGYGVRRGFGRLFFSVFVRRMTALDVPDTQCGIKAMREDFAAYALQKLTVDRFAFDIELFAIARALQLEYVPFPVTLDHSVHSTVRLGADTMKMMRDILAIRWNDRAGKYRA